jgi:hypothetical protein
MHTGPAGQDAARAPGVNTLARQLTGSLRCVRCTYELRGISITGVCPECGLPVKATLLAIVDPKAEELAPLRAPQRTARGLILWTLSAALAALLVWTIRIAEIAAHLGGPGPAPAWLGTLVPLAALASGVGALVLIRPHAKTPRSASASAALGAALSLPLAALLAQLHVLHDPGRLTAYTMAVDDPDRARAWLRLGIGACAAAMALLLRPSARMLAYRSVVVREGRVDRQSLLALAAAFGVAAVGDVLTLARGSLTFISSDLARAAETGFIVLGSVLVTLALVNLARDSRRLRPIIASRGVGLADVVESNADRAAREARP